MCLCLWALLLVECVGPGYWAILHTGIVTRSPKAGHPKAGRSDFRNQRLQPDTGKILNMHTVPGIPEEKERTTKQGSDEIPQSENTEDAENADAKTQKVRLIDFIVIGFR